MKDYFKTLEYLYGLEKFGIIFGLDNVRWLLSLLGDPHRLFKTVHVGGTNGKGSVTAMISSILEEDGYRTGAYTSPHLVSFTERITVNREPILEEEVVRLTREIKGRVDGEDPRRKFTFFDFTTALAFEYFRRQRVDIAVIEVGLGGRLDSTNVIEPAVSVITNVDLDHRDYLGDTVEEIAGEKAGIIKEGVPAVTGAEGPALEVIKKAAADKATLYVLGETFGYEKRGEQVMSYRGIGRNMDDVRIGLEGDHQLFNAALALCAVEVLNANGFALSEDSMRRALSGLKWPGRLEVVGGNPKIILDAAHNSHATMTLVRFLKTHFQQAKKVLVFGVMKDKDFPAMLAELFPLFDRVILTKPDIGRAASPEELAVYVPEAITADSVEHALDRALPLAGTEGLVVITGSFYTIGEAKRLLEKTS